MRYTLLLGAYNVPKILGVHSHSYKKRGKHLPAFIDWSAISSKKFVMIFYSKPTFASSGNSDSITSAQCSHTCSRCSWSLNLALT